MLIVLPMVLHKQYYGKPVSYSHYYLQKNYKDAAALFTILTEKDTDIFLWCCDCILFYAKKLNVSYGELNIYVFIIWQPYLIILFGYLYISVLIKNIKLQRKFHQPIPITNL